MDEFECGRITSAAAPTLRPMTFPVYRHLLSLAPAPRHPEQGDTRLVQPLGVAAWRGGVAAGLVLAEASLEGDRAPELLSLCVKPPFRNRGLGSALVRLVEDELRAAGSARVEAVYMMTGTPGVQALERVFEKREWAPAVARMLTLRFTLDEAAQTPWFGRMKFGSSDYEIFAWTDLTADERAELIRSHEASGWIATGLEPWRHDRHGFEPVSSLGLRYRGTVVGWVINHRTSAQNVRFTCSFMRTDLARRGRILALYTESLTRLRDTECQTCTLTTPASYGPMWQFLRRRCIPWAEFSGETRGISKNLSTT